MANLVVEALVEALKAAKENIALAKQVSPVGGHFVIKNAIAADVEQMLLQKCVDADVWDGKIMNFGERHGRPMPLWGFQLGQLSMTWLGDLGLNCMRIVRSVPGKQLVVGKWATSWIGFAVSGDCTLRFTKPETKEECDVKIPRRSFFVVSANCGGWTPAFLPASAGEPQHIIILLAAEPNPSSRGHCMCVPEISLNLLSPGFIVANSNRIAYGMSKLLYK